MNPLKVFAAAAVIAAPMLGLSAPAQALTSHQYQAQGHGAYVSSKARGYGWHRPWGWRRHYGWHRHWRRY